MKSPGGDGGRLPPTLKAPLPLPALEPASVNHYLVLCGLSLAVIFLAQLQQGLLLGNLLSVLVGILGLASKLRIGPALLVFFFGGVQLYYQTELNRMQRGDAGFRLQTHEMLLCAAVLGYVMGHYRLQTFWRHLWTVDPRQHAGAARRVFPWLWRGHPVLRETRPRRLVTPWEIVWFVLCLPAWAVVGLLLWGILSRPWALVGMPANLVRILLVVFVLAIVSYLTRGALAIVRHWQRDERAARLLLQDVLWKETRGEQRRINRWLAWWHKEE